MDRAGAGPAGRIRTATCLILLLSLAVAVNAADRAPEASMGGGGASPSPTPPNQLPNNLPSPTVGTTQGPVVTVKVVGSRRWLWSLRSLDGRPVEVGATDDHGFVEIVLAERVMLLDVPEAGVFGMPVTFGTTCTVLPDA